MVTTQLALAEAMDRIDGALKFTAGGTEKFWSRPVGARFDDYELRIASSIPTLLFGNQKGGVGKSTFATNLAAAFASKRERVHTVDLDYPYHGSCLALLQISSHATGTKMMETPSFMIEGQQGHRPGSPAHQHRQVGVRQYLLSNAPKEDGLDTPSAVRSHQDQVCALQLRRGDDRLMRMVALDH
jgi:hypothetical protein